MYTVQATHTHSSCQLHKIAGFSLLNWS